MNQIIIDNRHKIDTACQLCFYELNKYNRAIEDFLEEQRRIAATPYIQQEQERMVKRAENIMFEKLQAYYGEIKSNLADIRSAASEMDNVLDISEDFQNTLAVVKALGNDMPAEMEKALVEPFKGQLQALKLLKTAYESAGISTENYFDTHLLSSSVALDKLDDMAYRLVVQPDTNLLIFADFGNELEKFALSYGVELTKGFRDIVDISGSMSRRLAAAAGVGTAD